MTTASETQQPSDDPWDMRKLGWRFGYDLSALMALRGLLEQGDAFFKVGRYTLYDALREYSEMRTERDTLRTQNEALVAALASRPFPVTNSDLFRALGDPVRWMDRYRTWHDATRIVTQEAQR